MKVSDLVKKHQIDLGVKPDGIAGELTKSRTEILYASDPDSEWTFMSPAPPSLAPQTPSGTIIAGIDSVEPISATWIARGKELMGVAPAFIGRYFGPGRPATYQYVPAQENGPAAEAGVKILLIAEQTNRVGTDADADADGRGNATNIIAAFGADYLATLGKEFLCFLDCEGQPDLTPGYWRAWSEGLIGESENLSAGRFTILPAIYASENDGGTWIALRNAMDAGALCSGAWIASYAQEKASPRPFLPAWNSARAKMNTGDNGVAPAVPALLWQYLGIEMPNPTADDKLFEAIDANLLNPATDAAAFLARCVTPPGAIA